MAFTEVIYLCCALVSLSLCNIHAAFYRPPSPCPNVFSYEGDVEPDRWHGVITFSSNIELVGMNYKVQLDRPSHLLVSWDGEVRSDDNTNYNVFDPFHTQKAGEVVKARIMVKYNPNSSIPGISRIVINGNTMCNKDGNSGSGFGVGLSAESTTRYDPSFNEGDDIASEFSNNGGHSSNNYAGSSSNYNNENNANFESRPNSHRPSYSNNEGSSYSGSNSPNYNSNRPSYSNNAATTSPVFVVNPSNTGSGSNSASYVPSNSNSYNGNEGTFSEQSNHNNPEYTNNNRPHWSDTPSSNSYNRTNSWQSNGQSNSPTSSSSETNANGGPIVTTLTLPNTNPNKTNVDQIVQIIKNQLEQQQISVGANKTVIVAVVNSMPNSGSQGNINTSATTADPPVVYRTTTIPTSTVSSKAKIVVSTAKSSSSNGHTNRSKD